MKFFCNSWSKGKTQRTKQDYWIRHSLDIAYTDASKGRVASGRKLEFDDLRQRPPRIDFITSATFGEAWHEKYKTKHITMWAPSTFWRELLISSDSSNQLNKPSDKWNANKLATPLI